MNIEKLLLRGSLRGPLPVPLPALPRPKIISKPRSGHYAKPNRSVIRSNSMDITESEKSCRSKIALSNKFHACSLDELDSSSVVEVGSLASGKSSEHSLVDALVDIPSRSINTLQSSGFDRLGGKNNVDEYRLRAQQYSISTPALYSIETTDKTSESSTSSSSGCEIPEPDYARPNIFTEFNDVNSSDQKSLHLSSHSLGRSGKKACAPKSPAFSFIPRISVNKRNLSWQSTDDMYNIDQESNNIDNQSRKSENENLKGYTNTIYNSSEPFTKYVTISDSNFNKFNIGRHLDNRITYFESNPLPVIEENDRLSNDEYVAVLKSKLPQDLGMQKPAVPTTPKPKVINISKSTAVKPPRYSVLQKQMQNNEISSLQTSITNCDVRKYNTSNCEDMNRLEKALTSILDNDSRDGREYYVKCVSKNKNNINSSKTQGQYELAHQEVLENSDQLLDRIPSGEIRRNKIVLRVPSFRTAGCQTDSFKPVRRRASCAQTNLSVAPRKNEASSTNYRTISCGTSRWPPLNEKLSPALPETSSSSGYSSPEVSSKDPSPNHSGPPSPAAKTATQVERPRRTRSNVTVIEINKSENTTLISTYAAPPRPPKPIRFRHSAAGDLGNGFGEFRPVQRKPKLVSTYKDLFGFSTISENIITLTEAVNPVIVHTPGLHRTNKVSSNRSISFTNSDSTNIAPRIIDMYPKKIKEYEEQISRAEVFAEDGRTSVLPRLRGSHSTSDESTQQIKSGQRRSVSPNSATEKVSDSSHQNHWSEDLDWSVGQRWREEREKELAERWSNDTGGRATAAYLASLELLASHYRHQAMINAKVN